MENEYQQFAQQYSEMKTQINNDSIVAQLTAEQEKTQKIAWRAAPSKEHRRSRNYPFEEGTGNCEGGNSQLRDGDRLAQQGERQSYAREYARERTIRSSHPANWRIRVTEKRSIIVKEGSANSRSNSMQRVSRS